MYMTITATDNSKEPMHKLIHLLLVLHRRWLLRTMITVRHREIGTWYMGTILRFASVLPEKWELSYLGPGGLDSVFYLPCTVQSLVRISSWRVGIVSHR